MRREKGIFKNGKVTYLAINDIWPNPDQPRKIFDEQSLNELAASIKQFGVLQPLSVRQREDHYELIAGERRLRASRIAGLDKVPCLILETDREKSSFFALIENLQRRDLDYVEEAQGILRLITAFGLSQEETARRIGKSQSAVANKLRILRHSSEVIELLRSNQLTERHARALLRLNSEEEKKEVVKLIVKNGYNVAQTDDLVSRMLSAEEDEQPKTKAHGRSAFVFKDVRLFLNTVGHAVDTMKNAGIGAEYQRNDTDDLITLTITIPKSPKISEVG